jgi:hypothetical protein
MHFYFSCTALKTALKGKNAERYDAISLFIDELPKGLEHGMAVEAMMFDIAKANNLDYNTDATKIEELAEVAAAKVKGDTPMNNLTEIVYKYFRSTAG